MYSVWRVNLTHKTCTSMQMLPPPFFLVARLKPMYQKSHVMSCITLLKVITLSNKRASSCRMPYLGSSRDGVRLRVPEATGTLVARGAHLNSPNFTPHAPADQHTLSITVLYLGSTGRVPLADEEA